MDWNDLFAIGYFANLAFAGWLVLRAVQFERGKRQ